LSLSTRLFHSFLFPVNSFQFFTLSTSISLRIPSIHLFLGLPTGQSSFIPLRLHSCFSFLQGLVAGQSLNPQPGRRRYPPFVWAMTFDLSSKCGPTSS
jgi:hypothetical protein